MAGKGIHSYTVQEGTNAGLGQGGSMFINGAAENTAPSGQVFVSITFLTETNFTTLVAEDNTLYMGTTGTTSDEQPPGDLITSGAAFPAGATIYGRWTTIQVGASDMVVAYLGS